MTNKETNFTLPSTSDRAPGFVFARLLDAKGQVRLTASCAAPAIVLETQDHGQFIAAMDVMCSKHEVTVTAFLNEKRMVYPYGGNDGLGNCDSKPGSSSRERSIGISE